MKSLLKLIFLPLFVISLYSNEIDINSSDINKSVINSSDSLYLSYFKTPKRLFVNQIFGITIKIIVTEDSYSDINFDFEHGSGIKVVYTNSPLKQNSIYLYKTFYFKAISNNIKLPDIIVTVLDNDNLPIAKNILKGKNLKAIKLNPPKDSCNILANSLSVKNFQVTQYDKDSNLIVLNLEANLSNLKDFHLNFAQKEWYEDLNISFPISKMSYFATIPSDIKNFKFSYFNLKKNRFETFKKEIDVKDETVSTQTDIKPNENSHKIIKILIFFSIAVLFLIITIFKKSFFYLFLAFIFAGYGTYLSIPIKTICIKKGAKVSILPTKNSTIFFIIKHRLKTKRLNKVNGYSKIELPNKKIGWVKDEDICKN